MIPLYEVFPTFKLHRPLSTAIRIISLTQRYLTEMCQTFPKKIPTDHSARHPGFSSPPSSHEGCLFISLSLQLDQTVFFSS